MMPRIQVSLSDSQRAWVQARAEATGSTPSQVVRRAVMASMAEEERAKGTTGSAAVARVFRDLDAAEGLHR